MQFFHGRDYGKVLTWVVLSLIGTFQLGSGLVCAAELKTKIEVQLQAAISAILPQLGDLTAVQKTMFTEEVLPEYQRFIRNYQATPQGVKVDVDQDSIRLYLKYYALPVESKVGLKVEVKSDPKLNSKQSPQILVLLKTEPTCEKCTPARAPIQQWVKAHLEKRGFQPDFLALEDIPVQWVSTSLEEHLESMAQQKKESAVLLVHWAPLPVDDLDTAHADEKKYSIRVYLNLLGENTLNAQKEVMENDSFELSLGRVWIDLFTDLGSKMDASQVRQSEAIKQEHLIEITGVKDFQHFKRVRLLLEGQLKSIGFLEDRVLSREKFTFAFYTGKNKEEVKKLLYQLQQTLGVGRDFNWSIP
jgi:hypothetical protein